MDRSFQIPGISHKLLCSMDFFYVYDVRTSTSHLIPSCGGLLSHNGPLKDLMLFAKESSEGLSIF